MRVRGRTERDRVQTETGEPVECGWTDGQRRERPGGRAGGVLQERGGPGGADWLRERGGGVRGDGLPQRPRQKPGCRAAGSHRPAQVCHGIPPRGQPSAAHPGRCLWASVRASGSPARAPFSALRPAWAPGAWGREQVLACASPSCPAPGPRFRRPGADGRRPARLPAPGRVCFDGRGSQSGRGRGESALAGDLPWALRLGTLDPQPRLAQTQESGPPTLPASDPPVPPELSALSRPQVFAAWSWSR